MIVYERTFEKCTLLGKHAIKTTFKEYFKDSRYDEPSENFAEEYTLIMNGYLMTIALKMSKRFKMLLIAVVVCSSSGIIRKSIIMKKTNKSDMNWGTLIALIIIISLIYKKSISIRY